MKYNLSIDLETIVRFNQSFRNKYKYEYCLHGYEIHNNNCVELEISIETSDGNTYYFRGPEAQDFSQVYTLYLRKKIS
jgi:hypothetical protein